MDDGENDVGGGWRGVGECEPVWGSDVPGRVPRRHVERGDGDTDRVTCNAPATRNPDSLLLVSVPVDSKGSTRAVMPARQLAVASVGEGRGPDAGR